MQASPKHKAYALTPGQRNKNYAQSAYPPFRKGGVSGLFGGEKQEGGCPPVFLAYTCLEYGFPPRSFILIYRLLLFTV